MYILALESSTSSAKAMYYDTDCGTFDLDTIPYLQDYPGDCTRFRPDRVYSQLVSLARRLIDGRRVDIIALGCAWHSVGLFNDRLEPMSPMYQWSSNYGSEVSSFLRRDEDFTAQYYYKTGCMVNNTYPYFKLCKLAKEHKLSNYYILGQGTYNNYRLTGQLIATDCIVSGSGLMNISELRYEDTLTDRIGICKDKLPEICSADATFQLTMKAADELGVEAGIPVIPSFSDGALNQAGVGALKNGIMTMSVGTSAAIRLCSDKPLLAADRSLWCYRSPVSWLSGAAVNGGTNCIDWFCKAAFDEGTKYADIESNYIDDHDTPVFLPFVFGERCPGWDDSINGSFCGLMPQHTRYDMYRAVQEGILFSLKQCFETLTSLRGEPERISFSGGILHSSKWSQLAADIFERELETDVCEQASLSGAVLLAKHRIGLIDDLRDYSFSSASVIHPNKDRTSLYREKYERYLHYYNMLKGNI